MAPLHGGEGARGDQREAGRTLMKIKEWLIEKTLLLMALSAVTMLALIGRASCRERV